MKINLKGFAEFAAKKTGTYDFETTEGCAFAQYLLSLGLRSPMVLFREASATDTIHLPRVRVSLENLHLKLPAALAGVKDNHELEELESEGERLLEWSDLNARLQGMLAEKV